jgi:hypothetical protein
MPSENERWVAATARAAAGLSRLGVAEERRRQFRLVSDIFRLLPPPFTCHDSQVERLAQAAYEERILPGCELDRARLAVLADAVEETGCTNADLLGHLRGPGPHVRRCFVVDLLTGRE